MSLIIYQVDAFTNRPFAGNPAGVCVLDREVNPAWMQSLANEMNLAETAFIVPQADGFSLRWFTPTIEVDLCGHATLASAHLLWEIGRVHSGEAIRFYTRSGWLSCRKVGTIIEMDFPAEAAVATTAPPELILALGKYPVWCGKNRMDMIVQLKSEEAVRNLKPDLSAIAQLPVRGLIVTAQSDTPGIDFVSRFFAPQSGVDEDPVTGSAHCCLGPFWQQQLGKNSMIGFQVSARGGQVNVTCQGDRVILGGEAVTVFRAELSTIAQPK